LFIALGRAAGRRGSRARAREDLGREVDLLRVRVRVRARVRVRVRARVRVRVRVRV